jgi:hypothetical protein
VDKGCGTDFGNTLKEGKKIELQYWVDISQIYQIAKKLHNDYVAVDAMFISLR